MGTTIQLFVAVTCGVIFATLVTSSVPLLDDDFDSDAIDGYGLTDDGYDYSSYRDGRQLINITGLNLTALLINKANATLNDGTALAEKIIGKILIASSIALTLLSIGLALFAGLAEFGYSRSYYDYHGKDYDHGKDHYRRERSLNEDDEGYSLGENVVKLMELAKEMYDGYDVKSVDCHRRLMCQLSKTEAYRQVGADKAFTLASFVGNWIDLPPPVRVMVDQLKYAVSFGKKDHENAEKRLREARRLQQLQVPYYVNSDASVSSAQESHGQQSLDEELRDSCEAAFPDCDFSFEKFIVEHRRK